MAYIVAEPEAITNCFQYGLSNRNVRLYKLTNISPENHNLVLWHIPRPLSTGVNLLWIRALYQPNQLGYQACTGYEELLPSP